MDALIERVRKALSRRQRVEEKRLMGSLAFMVNGAMCCSVRGEGLLVRVTPEELPEVLKAPSVSPMKLGARTMKGFVRVDSHGVRTEAQLEAWLARGLAAAAARKARG